MSVGSYLRSAPNACFQAPAVSVSVVHRNKCKRAVWNRSIDWHKTTRYYSSVGGFVPLVSHAECSKGCSCRLFFFFFHTCPFFRPGSCLQFLSRILVGFKSAIPLLVDFSSSVANSRSRAFRKSICCAQEKSPHEFLRVCMHSGGCRTSTLLRLVSGID